MPQHGLPRRSVPGGEETSFEDVKDVFGGSPGSLTPHKLTELPSLPWRATHSLPVCSTEYLSPNRTDPAALRSSKVLLVRAALHCAGGFLALGDVGRLKRVTLVRWGPQTAQEDWSCGTQVYTEYT